MFSSTVRAGQNMPVVLRIKEVNRIFSLVAFVKYNLILNKKRQPNNILTSFTDSL